MSFHELPRDQRSPSAERRGQWGPEGGAPPRCSEESRSRSSESGPGTPSASAQTNAEIRRELTLTGAITGLGAWTLPCWSRGGCRQGLRVWSVAAGRWWRPCCPRSPPPPPPAAGSTAGSLGQLRSTRRWTASRHDTAAGGTQEGKKNTSLWVTKREQSPNVALSGIKKRLVCRFIVSICVLKKKKKYAHGKHICSLHRKRAFNLKMPSVFLNHWTWCRLVLVFQGYAQEPHFITALFSSLIYTVSPLPASVKSSLWPREGKYSQIKRSEGKTGNVFIWNAMCWIFITFPGKWKQ